MAETARDAIGRVRALATGRSAWTVLVDGRSGAGKSSLADAIVAATGAALLRLDDVYPGWSGLAAGAEAVRRGVLVPRATGRSGAVRRWDWARGRPGATAAVAPCVGLIVEGCGVLTRRSAALADLTVWVELDTARRHLRAMARDGETFRGHWDDWAAQEDAVAAAERPRDLARVRVDGATVQPMPRGRPARPQ